LDGLVALPIGLLVRDEFGWLTQPKAHGNRKKTIFLLLLKKLQSRGALAFGGRKRDPPRLVNNAMFVVHTFILYFHHLIV